MRARVGGFVQASIAERFFAAIARRIPLAVTLLVAVTLATPKAHAQIIVGSVKDSVSGAAVVGATVTVFDSTNAVVAEDHTGSNGGFTLDAKRVPKLRFAVRKIGVQPSHSLYFDVPADSDTLAVELLIPVSGVMLTTVSVTASVIKPNYNTHQLNEARQYGWRIIEPYRVAADRSRVIHFNDLLRRNPIAGVRPPRVDGDCITSSRSNRCLVIVVDGQVLGPHVHIPPEEVYFIAFLNAMQSQLQYGIRAPEGAIFVATRRRGDDERKPPVNRPQERR